MRQVYRLLADLKMPNVDRMEVEKRCSVTLEPRGEKCAFHKLLERLSDLVSAVKNVLQALVVLHAAGWMHRYIRWANVLKECPRQRRWLEHDLLGERGDDNGRQRTEWSSRRQFPADRDSASHLL